MVEKPGDEHPLFVYGTLLCGQVNHYLLKGRVESIVRGWMEGVELYSLGTYPMMVEGRRVGRVSGEIIFLRSDGNAYATTLEVLDRLEGVESSHGPYRRVLRTAHAAGGEETVAWVYLGRRALVRNRPHIVSGDWAAYQDQLGLG